MIISKDDGNVLNLTTDKRSIALRSVLVEPGKIVATDGNILGVRYLYMEDEEKTFKPFRLDAQNVKSIISMGGTLRADKKDSAKYKVIKYQKGKKKDMGIEVQMQTEKDGIYPEYQKVIPRRKDKPDIILDAKLLIKLLKIFADCKDIFVSLKDSNTAIRFDSETKDGRPVIGVMMPKIKR